MRNVRLCHFSRASTVSRVVPGMSLTIDALFAQQPIEQRRLADVRAGRRWRPRSRARSRGRRCRAAWAGVATISSSRSPIPGRARLQSRSRARIRAGRTRAPGRARACRRSCSRRATAGTSAPRRVDAISSSAGTSPSRPSTTKTSRSAVSSARRPCATTSSWSGSSLAPNMPPVSTRLKATPRQSAGKALTSRVVPATGVTIARREPVIRLKSVDFPTLGRPTSTTFGVDRTRVSETCGK